MDKDEHGDECDDDADGDGYDKTEDCNDLNPNIKPAAIEICNNLDDDCNNAADDNAVDCISFYKDVDKDKYGATDDYQCLCSPSGEYNATNNIDCDDTKEGINPKAKEICDDEDNDCDNSTDEENADDCEDYYFDYDGDDYGVTGNKKCLCAAAEYYRGTKQGDCNDYDEEINPEKETGEEEQEILCNGKDDDCDGNTDEKFEDLDNDGIKDCVDPDRDGDGILNTADNCKDIPNPSQSDIDKDESGDACDPDADGDGYFVNDMPADCNDLNRNVHPGASELCNGLDDDCDNSIDSNAVNCLIFYRDHDLDNYGDPDDHECLCSPEGEYTSLNPSDCNDSDSAVNPQAVETCDNLDNNCNGFVDEAFSKKGSPCDGGDSDLCQEGTWICNEEKNGLVCSDSTEDNAELCNGIDDDCDGVIPDNENDYDHDGFRKCQGDCNDLDINIFPNNPYDDCQDGIDNNCDGVDGKDMDHDGYGAGYGCPDCNDGNASVNPDAVDFVDADHIDNNCDGVDGTDADHDGYPTMENDPSGTDCNDGNPGINPSVNDLVEGHCESYGAWKIERIDKTGMVGEYPAMAIGNSGILHAVYLDKTNKSLKYAENNGGTWNVETIDTYIGTWAGYYGADIAVDTSNNPHISYYDEKLLKYSTKIQGSWKTAEVEDIDSIGGGGSSIAIDSADHVHISYYDGQTLTLKYATNKYGTWRNGSIDDYVLPPVNGHLLNGSTAITADKDGFAHAAYFKCGQYDSLFGKCKSGDLYYASNIRGLWQVWLVDSENETGRNPSIFCDTAGRIHMTYYEADNGDLKYAVVDKNQKIVKLPIDENGDVGKYSSVSVDENGRVFIGYYDTINDRIRLAKKVKDKWEISDVFNIQSLNHKGSSVSMLIGNDRELLINFWDELNDDMVLAKSICSHASEDDVNCDGIDGKDNDRDGHSSMDSGGDDCDDEDKTIFPGADDIYGDDIDSNCDGADGVDADGDGFGSEASGAGDCNDADPFIRPDISDYTAGTCREYFWEVSTIESSGTAGELSSIALDSSDNVHVAYWNSGLKYATNKSGTWAIITPFGSNKAFSMDLDSSDNVHIAYQASYSLIYGTNLSGSWKAETVQPGNDYYQDGLNPSIAVDKDRRIHIVSMQFIPNNFFLKYSTNKYGFWQTYKFGTCGNQIMSIETDSRNNVHMAIGATYGINTPGKWTFSTYDPQGGITTRKSLAVDSGDFVHLAYFYSGKALKYATNRTKSCSSPENGWCISVLDSVVKTDLSAAISLDKNDFVHIMFNDDKGART
jgi:hypothetical protein